MALFRRIVTHYQDNSKKRADGGAGRFIVRRLHTFSGPFVAQ